MKKYGKLVARRERCGYLFVMPFILGLIFFFITPIIQSIMISFGKVDTTKGFCIVVEGVGNYYNIITGDFDTYKKLLLSIGSMITNVPFILVLSFVLAIMLKNDFPGRTVYRCIFFLPVVLAAGIMCTLGTDDTVTGIIQTGRSGNAATTQDLTAGLQAVSNILQNNSMTAKYSQYILDAVGNISTLLNQSGIQILLFLAALQSIPASLYEASSIEGATAWEEFWKITLPLISPQLLVASVYTIIQNFVNENNDVMQYIYEQCYEKFNYGSSSALAWIYFCIISVVLGIFYLLIKRFIFHYEE